LSGWASPKQVTACLLDISMEGLMAEMHHVKGASDGWLHVKAEPSGQIVAVPDWLRVQFPHATNGRDFLLHRKVCTRESAFP
jgi:hypothetical protein